jgi:hypothetical protein
MRWIKRLFAPYIVVMCEPFSDGQRWSYIFGDERRFDLRTFKNYEAAFESHTATLVGLSLGSPQISIKLIKLDVEQVRGVHDEVAYRVLIESYL